MMEKIIPSQGNESLYCSLIRRDAIQATTPRGVNCRKKEAD